MGVIVELDLAQRIHLSHPPNESGWMPFQLNYVKFIWNMQETDSLQFLH